MRHAICCALLAVAVGGLVGVTPGPVLAGNTTTTPFPGVTRLHRTTPDQNINVLTVDLCAAGVRVRAAGPNDAGQTVSSFAKSVGADLAINGDFSEQSGGGWGTDGPAAHNGNQWSGTDHDYVGPIAFGEDRATLIEHGKTGGLAPWMQEVVSGHPTLVYDGELVEQYVNPKNSDPLCTNRHPHTAIGLSEDRRKLIMATVDGRQSGMKGMTCRELANLMKFFGADRAMNLDGGGSATMWVRGKGVVNHPSDGRERVIGSHLGVHVQESGEPHHCARYKAAYAGGDGAFAEGTTVELTAGETATGTLTFRNTGKLPWDGETRLGTTEPRDRQSKVRTESWLTPARMAAVESETPPGEVGRFTFDFKAPDEPGTYREYFNLVQEGEAWFSDSGGPADDTFYFEVVSKRPASGTDTGVRDTGVRDSGQPAPDSGSPVDTEASGERDTEEGGSPTSDGSSSGEVGGDGSADGSTVATQSGCGCRSGGGGSAVPVVPMLLVVLIAGWRGVVGEGGGELGVGS